MGRWKEVEVSDFKKDHRSGWAELEAVRENNKRNEQICPQAVFEMRLWINSDEEGRLDL